MSLATMVRHTGAWMFDVLPPADWPALLRRHGGGFFHTAAGLRAGAPAGERVYGRLFHNGDVIGIVAGVRTSCRLSSRTCHLYCPTWPAFADPAHRTLGMARLAAELRQDGIAEVRWDSFDAACSVPPATVPTRWEYVISLEEMAEQENWPESTTLRRHVRRGDREGWQLRELTGNVAVDALTDVMENVVERGAERGARILAVVPPVVTDPPEGGGGSAHVYAAFRGEEMLAAVLLGRTATRAYYIMGGATPAGYGAGGSPWLHAHIASRLADDGLTYYNMGGAPLGATDPEDPSFGLHRFKTGFGAQVVPCAGDRWILRSSHLRGHHMAGWAAGFLP
jgi:hypothetical protein